MWRVYKAAGRPWPTLSHDDVTDYMVMEAVALRATHEEHKAAKDAEKKDWKKKTDHLKNL